MIRAALFVAMIAAAAVALAACGQKGPLRLPEPPPAAPAK